MAPTLMLPFARRATTSPAVKECELPTPTVMRPMSSVSVFSSEARRAPVRSMASWHPWGAFGRRRFRRGALLVLLVGWLAARLGPFALGAEGAGDGIEVDTAKKTVTIECRIAPRKLPNLTEVFPIEVVATWPTPRGQKAHETVVTFECSPSQVHAALVRVGLQPGVPAKGEAVPTGPELKVQLEVIGADGLPKQYPIEKLLVDRKTGKPLPPLKWYFTGSVRRRADPEKEDIVYGADVTGTLIAVFPVTDETVIQSSLTMKDEPVLKLEVNKRLLPTEGAAARLILESRP